MLNLRYIFRLTTAFLYRFRALMLIGVVLGIAVFFLLKLLLPVFSGVSTQRIGMTGRYATSSLPVEILEMIGDGLTMVDKLGNVEPNLATSWESPDKGKTWIFTLRDDIFWQDQKAVVSGDISYQFSDVTIERPDERTIVFKLQNPYSAFPIVVSRPTFKKGLLGTGEWKVEDVTLVGSHVDRIVLERSGQIQEKIIYKFYPTEERTKLAFQLGEVDSIQDILNPDPFITWPKVRIESRSDTGEYVAVFFNMDDSYLGEKNVRQALSYAINKEEFPGERAISPISIDSWAYNSQVKPYNYDLEKAKGMVDEFKKAASIEDLAITLSTSPVLLAQAELIANDWREIGINVTLQVTTNIPTEYQALLVIFDVPEDPDQYSVWHSTQELSNITNYQNPRIDKLLEDGRSQISLEERRQTYIDFQRFLVEDSPAAFLYYPTNYNISRR